MAGTVHASCRTPRRGAEREERGDGRDQLATVARELIDHGGEFLMIKRYKEGKLSLAGRASELDVSIGEALDLLAELGVEAPIAYDEYLKGLGLLAASRR